MDLSAVQQQLADLPPTFKRRNLTFIQWQAALAAGLYRSTGADDALSGQITTFAQAVGGWLDIWGLLFGIPRQLNESDDLYRARIVYEVTAGAGTPVGIATWIKNVWNINATVQEDLPNVGYTIQFLDAVTAQQIVAILVSLARIRPAGIPFEVLDAGGSGLFLNTINFLDLAPDVTGAYLTLSGGAGDLGGIPVSTNNAQPLLPDLMLTDPTLNPSLV